MEGIKVGEYCRTEYGICKLESYRESGALYFDKLHEELWSGDFQGVLYPCDIEDTIITHSLNIIDVIEVGDYVNGYKVSFIGKDVEPFVQCDYPVEAGITNHYKFYEEAIKSIVTHESFNSIKYEVI